MMLPFEFHRLSFWLGFLAGALLVWLLGRLRPLFFQALRSFRDYLNRMRQERMLGVGVRLQNDTMRLAQHMHLASPLFSLEEILIPPRLLAPPPPPSPGEQERPEDITERTLPYMPEWPELASFYGWPTLTLEEALEGGANLAIIGEPGSGRTVALAALAADLISREPDTKYEGKYPLFVHALNILGDGDIDEDTAARLIRGISEYASPKTRDELPNFVYTLLRQSRALLLLDGLDELPPKELEDVVVFLSDLLEAYSGIQIAASASNEHLDGLLHLGFVPVAIAPWNMQQRSAFVKVWGGLWQRHQRSISPTVDGSAPARAPEPALLAGWLRGEIAGLTPLELTLKVWAAYAGDILGNQPLDGVEAYLRRMLIGQEETREALEQAAASAVLGNSPVLGGSLAPLTAMPAAEEDVLTGDNPDESSSDPLETEEDPQEIEDPYYDSDASPLDTEEDALAPLPARDNGAGYKRAIPKALEGGLLTRLSGSRIAFTHPVIGGYLAGSWIAQTGGTPEETECLLDKTSWSTKQVAVQAAVACDGLSIPVETFAETPASAPLLQGVFTASRWLRTAPPSVPFSASVLRLLASITKDETIPVPMRSRLLAAIFAARGGECAPLFLQMLNSREPELRGIAALAYALVSAGQVSAELQDLLQDESDQVQQAACLALATVGNKKALESVISLLLHGNDLQRRAAAEALANHYEEGHQILLEATTLEDLMVRRAAVYGLVRINQPWSIDRLEQIRLEDEQWLVQNAAAHVLDERDLESQRVPKPPIDLHNIPWLIAFAAERGLGIAPGKAARDMLRTALKDGAEDQKLAALSVYQRFQDAEAVAPVFNIYSSEGGELQQAALLTLWHFVLAGMDIPTPVGGRSA